jgi:subtilisin family serine protease
MVSAIQNDVKMLIIVSGLIASLLFATSASAFQYAAYAQSAPLGNLFTNTTTLKSPTIRATQSIADSGGALIPGQYVVLLKQNATTKTYQASDKIMKNLTDKIQNAGVKVIQEYENVGVIIMKAPLGLSSNMTTNQLQGLINELKSDPHVMSVVQDLTVVAASQTLPTGIDRVDGDLSYTKSGDGTGDVDAEIAILDTGVSTHTDLNVYKRDVFNKLDNPVGFGEPGRPPPPPPPPGDPDDRNGHGTHVAGIAAAKDNTIGVVGDAPGARIWSIKVLQDNGKGSFGNLMAGVRLVTDNSGEIDVANLSLGFLVSDLTIPQVEDLQKEIKTSIDAGVVYVVAAMNGVIPIDASLWVPASFPDVITVSAITDSDGKCGGRGPTIVVDHPRYLIVGDRLLSTLHIPVKNPDDSFASYSNYGPKIDIAAPGTNILSTWIKNGYKEEDGTSMAAPHVAGAAALYKSIHPLASPFEVAKALIDKGTIDLPVCDGKGRGYFTGDPDDLPEPLLYLRNLDKDQSIDLTIHVPYPFPFKIIPEEIPHRGPIPPPPPPPANATEIIVSRPSNGTLSISQDSGALAYVPNPNFHGTDSFTLKINGTDLATLTISLN